MTTSTPRLYLVTPPLGDPASFLRDVGPALEAGDIAALLLRLEPADERALLNRAKSVAAVVQRRDIALLLDGRPELAARAGAHRAHDSGN
jgi:thiamine-phosphate pyrophosphorylase